MFFVACLLLVFSTHGQNSKSQRKSTDVKQDIPLTTAASQVKEKGGHDYLALVKIAGSWGYIDMSGKIAINPQFDNAKPFSDGLARVKKMGDWGFINPEGKITIDCIYNEAASFTK